MQRLFFYWIQQTGTSGGGGTGLAFSFLTTDTGNRKPPGTFVPFLTVSSDLGSLLMMVRLRSPESVDRSRLSLA